MERTSSRVVVLVLTGHALAAAGQPEISSAVGAQSQRSGGHVADLMDRNDITGRLGGIGCPALIVHGSEDAAIPLARAEQMRNALPGPVTFTVIGGAPHASSLTHPGPVNAEIVNFLHGLPS